MKRLILCILLNLVFFSISVVGADSSYPEISQQLKNSEQAVWKIENQYGRGTGFFVGPNHFITNFHVISGMLEDEDTFNDIVLSQEGSDLFLGIKRVLAVSALYDLVLLETEESVTNYLSLRESHPEPGENLFLAAYPDGIFMRIKKTGDIFYEDDQRYDFPVNHFDLGGASGGPVLDEEGLAVGVVFSGGRDILSIIRINHLKELIGGNIGSECSGFNFARVCLEREVQHLKELAEKGVAFAQYELADEYYKGGMGIQKDFEQAFQWMQRSAEQNHARAQYRLALIYYEGEGVQKDLSQAFHWFKRSAEQNLAQAQFNLAFMYYEGEGVQKDLSQALYWFKRSAEQNHAQAQFNLAFMYYRGEGVDQDLDQAFQWMKRSAEQGFVKAQYGLAFMYFKGEGVNQDLDQAYHWAKAAEDYPPAARLLLGIMKKKLERAAKE